MVWTQWSLDSCHHSLGWSRLSPPWIQVTLSHYRQNFHKKIMWSPVILSLLISLVSILGTLINRHGWYTASHIIFWLGVLQGLIGFGFHLNGVRKRVGSLLGFTQLSHRTAGANASTIFISSILGLTAIYGG